MQKTIAKILFGVALTVGLASGVAAQDMQEESIPDSLTLRVSHRMYPDFWEIVTTRLNERNQIGDTDLDFEVTEFFPHFAYLDSSKTFVSLSDEPVNPAFRINIYDGDELIERAWAFYSLRVPHFSQGTFIAFEVLLFEYRGEIFRHEEEKDETTKEEHPK